MAESVDELKIRIRELEKEVAQWKSKVKDVRYGLNWLEIPEAFDRESEDKIPILKEVPEKAVDAEGALAETPPHIIIEGDNYHALTCLNYTHRGKIDVIYIDPPYNTGSDGFTYKDKRFLTEYPDGQKVPKDHPLRHSYWLSFMEKRLKLAKNLLSEKGVIFISIDDNEQANLKLLCDKVFGEGNFVATIPWRKRTAKADVPYSLSQDYEWIICYAHSRFKAGIKKDPRKYYETEDLPGEPWRFHDLTKQTTVEERPKSNFTIVNPKTGDKYPVNPMRSWAITSETFDKYYNEGRIIFPGDYDFLKISKPVLRYFKEDDEKKAGEHFGFTTASTDLPKEVGMTQDGTKDMNELFSSKVFLFPKPISLIHYLLKIATPLSSKITILDFFAGSGTTLHATLKLNAEDGGKRQCILVQQAESENNICEKVTYERNRRVMQGYKNAKGEFVEGLGGHIKYYKTDFVGKHPSQNASDADSVELANKAGCLIALAENTLETVSVPESSKGFWQIYANTETKKRYTCIYHNGDYECVPEFVATIDALRAADKKAKFTVYVFSWNSPDFFENEFDDLKNIEIKAIPKPILEIYKALNG